MKNMNYTEKIPPPRVSAELLKRVETYRADQSKKNGRVIGQAEVIRDAIDYCMGQGLVSVPAMPEKYGELKYRLTIALVTPNQKEYVNSIAVKTMTGVSNALRGILDFYLSKEGVIS